MGLSLPITLKGLIHNESILNEFIHVKWLEVNMAHCKHYLSLSYH